MKESDFQKKTSSSQTVEPSGSGEVAASGQNTSTATAASESAVPDQPTDFETALPGIQNLEGDSGAETFQNIVQQVNDDKIATWLNLWELVDKDEKLKNGLDAVKAALLAGVAALESTVEFLKKLIKLALAFAGAVLDAVNSAVLALKAIIQLIKRVLSMVEELLSIDLFRMELKVAGFSFIPNMNAGLLKQGNMAPLVNSKLNDMTFEWFNRPEAEDSLCCALFIPIAVPAELTQLVAQALKFNDLIQEWVKMLMDFFNKKKPVPKILRGDMSSLTEMLDWLYVYDASRGRRVVGVPASTYIKKGTYKSVKYEVLERALSIVESLTESEKSYLKALVGSQLAFIDEATDTAVAAAATSAVESSGIRGVVDYRAYLDQKDESKIVLETNFKTDQQKFLSAAYKVTATGTPEKIFSDPSIKALKVIAAPDVADRLESLTSIYLAYSRWKRCRVKHPAENTGLLRSLDRFFKDLMPAEAPELDKRLVLPAEKLVFMSLADGMLKFSVESSQDPFGLKDYKKDIKKIEGSVDYSIRTTVNKNQRLFSSTIKFKDQGEVNTDPPGPDRLILLFEDAETIVLSKDFIDRGMRKARQTRAGLFAGSLEAVNNTIPAVVTINPQYDEGLQPRWYGAGSSNAGGNWTTGKLAQMLMPDEVNDVVDGVYGYLDKAEKMLDEILKGTDALKEKLREIEKEIDEFFDIIAVMFSLLKKLINALSLTQLPSIYTAFWRGSASRIPEILADALVEKNWLTSTYGGLIVFGSGDAAVTLLESYRIKENIDSEYDRLANVLDNRYKVTLKSFEAAAEQAEDIKERVESGEAFSAVEKALDNYEKAKAKASGELTAEDVIEDPAQAYRILVEERPVTRRKTGVRENEESKVKPSRDLTDIDTIK